MNTAEIGLDFYIVLIPRHFMDNAEKLYLLAQILKQEKKPLKNAEKTEFFVLTY